MTALETICEKSRARELAFLVCGRHAVMAHDFAGSTFDLDLLVRSAARKAWKNLLGELGWQLHAEGTTFLQFDSPPGQLEPVDLMFRQRFDLRANECRGFALVARHRRCEGGFVASLGRDEMPR